MISVSPENVGFSASRLKRLAHSMQAYVDDGRLAGMITTIARQGKTVHWAMTGMRDREAGLAMEEDTIFRIASMTKLVTAAAIMTLYEEGHFNLNTPVYEFIPEFEDLQVCVGESASGLDTRPLERPVTFRHLFTHTAGFSYGWDAQDPVDRAYIDLGLDIRDEPLKEKMAILVQAPLAFQPGTHWRYSLAIDVLGYLIEIISGVPLDRFFRERLFNPLGMADTDFFVPRKKVQRLAALYGHTETSSELQRIDPPPRFTYDQRPAFLSGGGGLVATATDYARFLEMLVNGGELDGERILSPTTVDLFTINHAPSAALPYGFAPKEDRYHMGYGFSLGTRVLMDISASGQAGSVGEFGWDGAFNTYCWVDRVQSLYGLLMVQHMPNNHYPLADIFKQLTYQALIDG